MGPCNGRCECHSASWDVLDEAAGISGKKHPGGRKFFESDAGRFERELRTKYFAEWDKEGRDPKRRPSIRRVAEDGFGWDRRTLRRTCNRLDVIWPPLMYRQVAVSASLGAAA